MQQSAERNIHYSLRDVERMTEEGIRIGRATNEELQRNGETLQRITNKVDSINGTLITAQHHAREIDSFWYSVKTKIRKTFGWKRGETRQQEIPATNKEQRVQAVNAQDNVNADLRAGTEQEDEMDRIINNLRSMKKEAKNMGQELDRQKPMIDNLLPAMEQAEGRMKKVKGILKKQLH